MSETEVFYRGVSRKKYDDALEEILRLRRVGYLHWYRYRCPHHNRRGDRCILTIWDHAPSVEHDYGYWIEHHAQPLSSR